MNKKSTKAISKPAVKTARVAIRIEDDLVKKLERKALAHSVSVSVIVRHALTLFLAEE